MEALKEKLDSFIKNQQNILKNLPRKTTIQESIDNQEASISKNGALATWTPVESTGRSPKDTVIVKRTESEKHIDWDSPNNIPIDPETFDLLFEDALKTLKQKEKLYLTNRVIGADANMALPVTTLTNHALTALFTDNMFRPVQENIEQSVFYGKDFMLVTLPYEKLNPN